MLFGPRTYPFVQTPSCRMIVDEAVDLDISDRGREIAVNVVVSAMASPCGGIAYWPLSASVMSADHQDADDPTLDRLRQRLAELWHGARPTVGLIARSGLFLVMLAAGSVAALRLMVAL